MAKRRTSLSEKRSGQNATAFCFQLALNRVGMCSHRVGFLRDLAPTYGSDFVIDLSPLCLQY